MYVDSYQTIFIFDNSSYESAVDHRMAIESELGTSKICFLPIDGENDGICVGINRIIDCALQNGYDYVTIFDQDSYITGDNFVRMRDFIQNYYDRESVVVFVPSLVSNKEKLPFEEVSEAITSGSFINLNYCLMWGV